MSRPPVGTVTGPEVGSAPEPKTFYHLELEPLAKRYFLSSVSSELAEQKLGATEAICCQEGRGCENRRPVQRWEGETGAGSMDPRGVRTRTFQSPGLQLYLTPGLSS